MSCFSNLSEQSLQMGTKHSGESVLMYGGCSYSASCEHLHVMSSVQPNSTQVFDRNGSCIAHREICLSRSLSQVRSGFATGSVFAHGCCALEVKLRLL